MLEYNKYQIVTTRDFRTITACTFYNAKCHEYKTARVRYYDV